MTEFWRLLKLAKPHTLWFLLGITLALVTTLANIALLAISGWFLAAMAAAGLAGVTMNYFTPSAIIRFLAITRTAGRYAERLVTHNATFKLLSQLRVHFYQAIEPLAPAVLQQHHSGDLLSHLQHDIDTLDHFYLRIVLPFAVAGIALPCIAAIIFSYDYNVLITACIAWFILGLALPYWIKSRNQAIGKTIQYATANYRTQLVDGLQGMRELIIYQASSHYLDQAKQSQQTLIQYQGKLRQSNAYSQALSLGVIHITVVITLALLTLKQSELSTQAPAPEIALLILLVLASFEAVLPLSLAFEKWSETHTAAKRLFNLMDQAPARKEPSQLSPALEQASIQFDNVSFSYPEQTKPALNQLSFKLKAGKKLAIVGRTGAGKSSIAQLLLGFWQHQAGEIYLGHSNINQFHSEDLREHITYVSQSTHLFTATIADNLRLANPQANQEAIEQACQAVDLHHFIKQLPNGYDTWVGSSEANLSGGQARRLSIAQALLKPASVVILDEPTEGLDPITEQTMINNLLEKMSNKTLIFITHRPHLLKQMDQVILLEQGKAQAIDTHLNLIKKNRHYRELLHYF